MKTDPEALTQLQNSETPLSDFWRDVLLRLSLALPIDVGLEPVMRQFLDGLRMILPRAAIGACVVSSDGTGSVVLSRLPAGVSPSAVRDPTRLFPGFHEERIFELEDGALGSTLHLATLQAFSPVQTQMASQATAVLARALSRARLYARAEESARTIRAQLIQNEKLASLGQIVAGVVHELNNPLTSIIAYSDFLLRKVQARGPSDDAQDDLERLRRIGDAATRILKFSHDLASYARPSVDLPGAVLVQEIVDQALIFCEHEFTASKISVRREFDPLLPAVRGMKGQLTQVFVNLFTNAAHAMSAQGGQLLLRIKHNLEAHTLEIEVSDSGAGIDAQDLPQIFEPFFTTKAVGRGTGLGLSIVRGIVDAHGGTIEARNVPGAGAIFVLSLPMAALGSS